MGGKRKEEGRRKNTELRPDKEQKPRRLAEG
jgi:hypothetical protein